MYNVCTMYSTVHVWVVSTYSTEKYCDKMHTQKVKTKKLKL